MILNELIRVDNFVGDTTINTTHEPGQALTNFGTATNIILTADAAIEIDGYWFRIYKQDTQNIVFNDSGASQVIRNNSNEVQVFAEIKFVHGAWVIAQFSGTWT